VTHIGYSARGANVTDLHQYGTPVGDTEPGTAQAAKDEATQVASTAADQGKQTASAAAEAASQTAGTAAEGAKQVASEAASQVTEVTRQATDQARELVGQAQSQLREQATTQTQKAASGLADVGRQIRALSDGEPDRAGFAADAARQLAGKVEEFANRLEQRGFDGTVEDVSNFARRRPGMFLLTAAATGFVVGRLGRGAQVAQSSQDGQSGQPGLGALAPQAATLPEPAVPLLPEPATPSGTPEPYLTGTTLPEFQGGA
jgi:hypothetical protein